MSGARAPRVGDLLLAALLVGMSLLVLAVGPGRLTRVASGALGCEEMLLGGHRVQPQLPRTEIRHTDVGLAVQEAISEEQVAATLASFASLPSRVPGYPGAAESVRLVQAGLAEAGLTGVTLDTFQVTVPVDHGGTLALLDSGEVVPLHALWPNQVRTPSTPAEGITGPLIDGGRGAFADFKGQPVDGSVVLMGFGCGVDYLNARSLGAHAVVFYDDGRVSREEALDKFLRVPADVPRYWVDRAHAERLLAVARQSRPRVRLFSRMAWETVPACNVYGYLPGRDGSPPGHPERRWWDDLIVLSAYHDAISVVPALAPGAENACSITALLHLARYLAAHPPAYPVLFLATGAHFQGLAGVNDFLYRHARQSGHFRRRMRDPIDFRLFVALDLSSHSPQVAAFPQGTFYTRWATNAYLRNLLAPYARRCAGYVEEAFPGQTGLPRFVDAVAPSRQTWRDFMPVGLALESEAAVFVGLCGMALATPNDGRGLVDTPLDRAEAVDAGNLTRQIHTLAALLGAAGEDPGLFDDTELRLKDQGHALAGRVCWFNREVNFAVPQDPVPGAVVTYQQPGPGSVAGVRTVMATRTDADGRFRYDILRNAGANRVLAYQLDEDGQITWAPDLGTEGDAAYPVTQTPVWWEDEMVEVLFPCRSLTLLQTLDARQLVALDRPTVLGADDAPLQWYGEDHVEGQSRAGGKVTPAAVVHARPGTSLKVLMGTGLLGARYLLTNAPRDLLDRPIAAAQATPAMLLQALGAGFRVEAGLVPRPLHQSTADMWILDDVRMKVLERYGVRNERMARLHEQARTHLLAARLSLERQDYGAYAAAVTRAAGLEGRAYPDVRATASDTVNGIVFYFVLLIPFSYFGERLLCGFTDVRRQLAGSAAIFAAVFLVLHGVHPAFRLSTSPYIVLLAFVILALGTAVIALVISRFREQMRQLRRQAEGVWEADVGRLSATLAAVLLGISNLRKRKVRTTLTAATLVLVSFTALSFTSVSSTIRFYRLPRGGAAAYEGALVRDRNWGGLQPAVQEMVAQSFGDRGTVAPRSWFLLPEPSGRAQIPFYRVDTQAAGVAYGIVGLTEGEPQVTGIDRLLGPGGRWFQPGERQACILPDDLAGVVGIGPADVGRAWISCAGRQYRVVGLVDAEGLNRLADLDGEKLTPVDLVSESSATTTTQQDPRLVPTAPIRSYVHLEASNVVLLPHEEVLDLGGGLRSVAVGGFQGDLPAAVEEFVTRVAMPTFLGHQGRVTVYSSLGVARLSGLGNLAVPLLIAALIVLNTMMGSVWERTREIGIYSSLGLTPVHVAALFLAEAGVFATLGAVLGYLLGQTLAMALSIFGLLQGMTLNYSSLSAVWATLVVMLTVFLSTLYPARKAAELTVPDVTRRWSLGEPEGDDWRFDFPFTVAGAEVLALYAYLTQVFRSCGEGSFGEFLAEDVRFAARGEGEQAHYRISMRAWLAPYDLGLSQEVSLEAVPTGEHRVYRIAMHLHRLSGDVASWQRLNRGFLNVLRRRFLVWRTVPAAVRQQYAQDGTAMLAAPEEAA
ncbi:MAG: FtsX-like permease family protein [Candidatus Latescibacterota bacterium]